MTARGRLVLGLTLLASLSLASSAGAQETPGRRVELALGGILVAPTTLGTSAAEFIQPDGRPLPVFQIERRLSAAIGGEAHLGVRLTPALAFEITGGWQRADLEVHLRDDVDDAPALTADERIWRVTVEGATLWVVRTGEEAEVFVRGGGGWLREMTGGGVLGRSGAVAHVGAGVKYWWLDRSTGRRSRLGIRIEGRLATRIGGIRVGGPAFAVAPAVAGGLIFGL